VRKLRAAGGAVLLARAGTGTLARRLRGLRCSAKTGTLDGVSNLAGSCRTRRGRTVTFAVMADRPAVADRVARALVRRG
jgi:D-alanyl-D-alanine carboxypeptidase/D-alanyl-D-alanine-endopeptidase (penicillin-binding protein 4)